MAREVHKKEKIVPIPVRIVSSTIDGTPTFTIQQITDDIEEIITEDDGSIETGIIEYQIHEEEEEVYQDQDQSTSQEEHIENDEEFKEFSVSTTAEQAAQLAQQKPKTFYCPHCGNCYSAAGSLKLHVRACERQKEAGDKALEARKCNVCGKVYNSASYLKEHMLRHAGKEARKCKKCYRKFVDDNKFRAHMKSHENEIEDNGQKKIIKEYTCSFCQKEFCVVFDSRHTARRYACDECREKFTNEEALRKHKESLEEKKEFHCEKCGRKFVFEGFLQRHAPTCDGTIKRKRDRVF